MILTGRGASATSAKPHRFSAGSKLPDLIDYLSPSLSTSRVSTTEVMPGTLFATSLA